MTFTRRSPYHEASACGRYTVCAIGPQPYRFEAWHEREQLAVNLSAAERAREICREHAERHQREAA